MHTLVLKKREEQRLLSGHLWLFSNEVDTRLSPLSDFTPGEEALLVSSKGQHLGLAYVNPHSLICARLFARDSTQHLDEALLTQRLEQALSVRTALFQEPYYRLVYGEGDFLPGLVIDRFADHLTIQISTAGMELRKEALRAALAKVIQPKSIFWANNIAARRLENLSLDVEIEGDVPDELTVPENNCHYTVPCRSGQKTGWFFDQRPNRAFVATLCQGKSVLDAFSYVGGFGVSAAKAGATELTFLDASEQALQYVARNMQANAPQTPYTSLCADAFEALQSLKAQNRRFDVVSIDPPAFMKRRKDLQSGLIAYRRLNALACSLVKPGGLLVTSSCSQHLHIDDLRQCVALACAKQRLQPRLLYSGFQGPDHPIHCAMPETAYLKCLCVALTPQV